MAVACYLIVGAARPDSIATAIALFLLFDLLAQPSSMAVNARGLHLIRSGDHQ
jgi:hypothetical protein